MNTDKGERKKRNTQLFNFYPCSSAAKANDHYKPTPASSIAGRVGPAYSGVGRIATRNLLRGPFLPDQTEMAHA